MKGQVAIESVDSYRLDAVKEGLRRLCTDLGCDAENPFGSFIKPGMTVFIKPNWVASRWRESCPHRDTIYSVITHPSVIEATADFVDRALMGKGKIIIADNPSIDADFEELLATTGICKLQSKYSIPCEIFDLRPLVCKDLKDYGKREKMTVQRGDPNGEIQINLKEKSMLRGVDSSLFRGVFNEREETVKAHTGDTQLYTYSRSLYDADVYISVPKLKTHQKVGTTLNIKGLVGSITQKNQLVHWRVGCPESGGDEYPDRKSYEEGQKATVTHRGAWPGNDTIWRMVADLYEGMLLKKRNYFTVIDGIIGGEGQGPFCPNAKCSNTLIASNNLLYADIVASRYMGFDPKKIKYLEHFMRKEQLNLDNDIQVIRDGDNMEHFFSAETGYKNFHVTPLWEEIKWTGNPE